MATVAKKIKKKVVKKPTPVKVEKKFVSQSLENKKVNKQAIKKGKKKSVRQRKRGIVYIKHLPHGFYEEQLRGYFSQFGAVTRVRLARSTKTLGSKGYAFIEFRYPEVAEIAAEAMNNYLMFKNIIKTRFIPPNEIKHDYFRSGVKKIKKDGVKVLTSKSIESRQSIIENINRLMTTDDEKKRKSIVTSKIQKSKKKLEELGINFDMGMIVDQESLVVEKPHEPMTKKKKIDVAKIEEEDSTENIDIDSGDEFDDMEFEDENDSNAENSENEQENLVKAVKKAKAAKVNQDVQQKKKNKKVEQKDIKKIEETKLKNNQQETHKKTANLKKNKNQKPEKVLKKTKAKKPSKPISEKPEKVVQLKSKPKEIQTTKKTSAVDKAQKNKKLTANSKKK